MAISHILRVSIGGSMPGSEKWSVNPVFAVGGDFGVDITAPQLVTIANAIANVSPGSTLISAMAPSCSFTGVRVEARTLAGVLNGQADGTPLSPGVGAGSSVQTFQTAAVISLRTSRPGGSGRGRLYWPATGVTLQSSNLRPTDAVVAGLANGAKTYLSGIQTAIDATLDGVSLVVWSRLHASTANVNAIQVGNILDTQRRRRDSLPEAYQGYAYP